MPSHRRCPGPVLYRNNTTRRVHRGRVHREGRSRTATRYAHPGRRSFTHAVLEAFTRGLREAGHTLEVGDLYTMGFTTDMGPQEYARETGGDTESPVDDEVVAEHGSIDAADGIAQSMQAIVISDRLLGVGIKEARMEMLGGMVLGEDVDAMRESTLARACEPGKAF